MENHVAGSGVTQAEPRSSSAQSEAYRRRQLAKARSKIGCDLLLARLFIHHRDHAVTFLKGIKPKVVDLEPGQIKYAAEIIPIPTSAMKRRSVIEPSIAIIMQEVARFYGTSVTQICSARRSWDVVRPRQIAMYLAKEMTLKPLTVIARCMGGRDHTTVLHGIRRIEGLVPTDERLGDEIDVIKLRVSRQLLNLASRSETEPTPCSSAQTTAQ